MDHRVRNIGFTIIVLITLMLIISGSSFLFQSVRAQSMDPIQTINSSDTSTVQVQGTGQVSAQPDQAVVLVGVQTQADSASDALSENNTQIQALLQALRDAGINANDIQTQSVQLYPQYNQPSAGNSQSVSGYVAMNTVQARVRDLDRLGGLLDTSVQAGGNLIQSINFEVSNLDQATDSARQQAMDAARRKAEQLARLAGASLGPIVSVREVSANTPWAPLAAQAVDSGGAVPIQPGSQPVQVILEVTWQLLSSASNAAATATSTP